ncbi:GNAT family N-acetyltransferase [Microbacterium immunditiarum]|uniref:Putative GNAT superfamily acetyltransferase n=1 Tax=Microbacterium immunditiarum TaxID=337480 RepID=A0A7Y9GL83_9MICO|nr:GNAT family N-acetyltransferase [Microbacterium immunditiarum]NYE18386.1 putative GNAT superfamily acetyltransferase [Microbacterium immunditiarum]
MTVTLEQGRLVATARDDAARLAEAAGADIRLLSSPDEMVDASALFARVWRVDVDRSHVNPGLLVALAHSDNYVAGAFRGGRLIGASVGFFHPPAESALHSHITGVDAAVAGRGVGRALKFHQRAWALEHGARRMTWTFDPLVARNAYFNVQTLAARGIRYLSDFYGVMSDGVNAGQESDRMLIEWTLDDEPASGEVDTGAPPVLVVADDRPAALPLPADAAAVRVDIPRDIEGLRTRDPDAARLWRLALRGALSPLMAGGWRLVGVSREGSYHLERPL